MARFCLATGVQPSEYKHLNGSEVKAFVKVWNDNNKKR